MVRIIASRPIYTTGMHGHGKILIFRSVYLGSQCSLSAHGSSHACDALLITLIHLPMHMDNQPPIATPSNSLTHSLTHSLILTDTPPGGTRPSTHYSPSDPVTHLLTYWPTNSFTPFLSTHSILHIHSFTHSLTRFLTDPSHLAVITLFALCTVNFVGTTWMHIHW